MYNVYVHCVSAYVWCACVGERYSCHVIINYESKFNSSNKCRYNVIPCQA